MATSKKDREIIFNKYGGRCAYCGDELIKGWHVDHLEPIIRDKIWEPAYIAHRGTPSEVLRPARWVDKGCRRPELDCIENKMPSCASCNLNKHSFTLEGFRDCIMGYMKHLNEISTQYKVAKRYGLVKEEIKPIVFYFETLKQNKL